MKLFMEENGYYLYDFCSFDTFAGTRYKMTLTYLVRRPSSIILPIGPPGVGKSILGISLMQSFPHDSLIHFERDVVFSQIKNTESLASTKQKTHQAIQDVLTKKDTNFKIIYLDSTNGSQEGRQFYIETHNSQTVIEICFVCQEVDFLLSRTLQRKNHPSFPLDPNEQKEKISKILSAISYPTKKLDDRNHVIIQWCIKEHQDMFTLIIILYFYLFLSKSLLEKSGIKKEIEQMLE